MNDSSTITRANMVATGLFVLSSSMAAAIFEGFWKVQGVVVSLVMFAIGIAAFLWGYWSAVQRSRDVEMSVAELYFLMGDAIPRRIKRVMLGCLAVQVVAALVTAIARPSTPATGGGSTAGSTLAFGVLVPVLGLGLNGLWAARSGEFPPRRRTEDA